MFTVLFADDEPFVIEGLKIMIDWESLGIEIVGEASDGETAFELIKTLSPDIVISDICMPGICGTELLQKCSGFMKKPEFIMLTGYGDMEYIRAAMKYGAKGYLLKPIDQDEVVKTLNDLCTDIAAQCAQQDEMKELFNLVTADAFQKVFFGDISEEAIDKCRFILGLKQDAPLMLIGYRIARDNPKGVNDSCFKKILSVTPQENACVFTIGYRHIFVVNANTDPNLNRAIAEAALNECTGINIVKTDGMHDLPKAYFAIMRNFTKIEEDVTVVRFIKNNNLPLTISDAEHVVKMAVEGSAEAAYEKLSSDINEMRLNRTNLDLVCGYAVSLLIYMARYAHIAEINMESTFEGALSALSNAYDYDITEALCKEFLDIFLKSFCSVKNLREVTISEKITDYIKKHYGENLTLACLSRHMEISAGTISKIIKQKTGMKFSDYINFIRIQNAKKMLRYSNAKITSIAIESGYHDYYYFASKFKDMTGERPSDYRKKRKVWDENTKKTQQSI